MATTLERASFGIQPGGKTNLKFIDPTGIVAGNTLTVTTPPPYSKVMTVSVLKLLPYGSAKVKVLTTSTSGILVLPKGSTVA